jgi:uncharacterized protein (TIGR03663 family)
MIYSFPDLKKSEMSVGTSSTKSSASRKRPQKSTGKSGSRADLNPEPVPDIPEQVWRIAAVSIFCLAAFLRFFDLNLVPLHHDEGVNGNFLLSLVRDGRWNYDPANYHGPTLYYFSAIVPWTIKILFGTEARETYGLTTILIRSVTSLFGLATVWLVFLLRRRLGSVATLVAGLLLAISPGAVYLSRYYIHESLFVFFTLGVVVAAVKFYDRRNPVYLLLSAASAALLFATKETAMISAGVFIIALVITKFYPQFFALLFEERQLRRSDSQEGFVNALGGPALLASWVALAGLVFILLNVVFYSSFFTNFPKGVSDSLATFKIWTKTGQAHHVHPIYTYLRWLAYREGALLALGIVGAVFVVFSPKNRFALFTALWAFGVLAAYSLVPYKTPWLALNFIIPLALISGYAVQRIFELERGQLRLPIVILLAATMWGTYQSVDLNFFNYDNDDSKYVYVYAHTKRGTIALVDEIERIARQGAQGGKTGITIVSPDYWPLPWYLRNYSRVGYFGRMSPSTEPIIIASEGQKAEIESTFGDLYEQVSSDAPGGTFDLRPGVSLLLYRRTNGERPPLLTPPQIKTSSSPKN